MCSASFLDGGRAHHVPKTGTLTFPPLQLNRKISLLAFPTQLINSGRPLRKNLNTKNSWEARRGGWLSWRVLARPRPVCKNIWGEIGDCHVTAAARIVPHPFLGISVSDFRKFNCTTHNFFQEFVVSHTLLECVGNATRRCRFETQVRIK